MNFDNLRSKHKQLIYEGFNISHIDRNLKIIFQFTLTPNIKFNPVVIFPGISEIPQGLENLVFNLGLVELLSYWKAACSPEILIKAGYLGKKQISFWKNLLIKGLGEFFYTNKINFTKESLINFVIASEAKQSNSEQFASSQTPRNDKTLKDRDLVLIGGGKDSAVTLDNISKSDREFNCLILNPTDAAINISKAAGCPNPIIIKRTIDPKLLELNKKGCLNGHTPFSAYLAFLATLSGVLYDYKNLVVSNEKSSDEANIEWLGEKINHQYSKTTKFENDFRRYSSKYLATTNYFSFIRQYGELEISEMFSKMEKYHSLFRSCNKGSKTNSWCGKCPKCVSTYLTLYPFLGNKMKKIFGKDLLEDESLVPIVKGLLRENNVVKPFECVATVEEIKKAIYMGMEKVKEDGIKIPKLLNEITRS